MGETAERSVWENFAQPWELGWWTKHLAGKQFDQAGAAKASAAICEVLEITPELIKDKIVLDVGNGPTGRLQSLVGVKGDGLWVGLDPLNSHYVRIQDRALDAYDQLLSVPCEEWQPELVGQCETIISINALDHGFDLPLSLVNLWQYLRAGGRAIISFDCFEEEYHDFTHPIRLSRDEADALIRQTGFLVLKQDARRCHPDRDNWGGGVHQHWWLERPEA